MAVERKRLMAAALAVLCLLGVVQQLQDITASKAWPFSPRGQEVQVGDLIMTGSTRTMRNGSIPVAARAIPRPIQPMRGALTATGKLVPAATTTAGNMGSRRGVIEAQIPPRDSKRSVTQAAPASLEPSRGGTSPAGTGRPEAKAQPQIAAAPVSRSLPPSRSTQPEAPGRPFPGAPPPLRSEAISLPPARLIAAPVQSGGGAAGGVEGGAERGEGCGVACLINSIARYGKSISIIQRRAAAPEAPGQAEAPAQAVPVPLAVDPAAASPPPPPPPSLSAAPANPLPQAPAAKGSRGGIGASVAVTPKASAESGEGSRILTMPTERRSKGLEAVRARKGIIFFTHIRRAGGTVLEDYVLKPFVQRTGRKAYLCKEGELGRFYRMSEGQASKYRPALKQSALVWRHCPYGLHTILRPEDEGTYVYVTLIRKPIDRLFSWYKYCDKYSPNKCNAGKNFMQQGSPGESGASKFYSARLKLYESTSLGNAPPSGTFHPNNLEYRLDDNYQTRMLCGPAAHDQLSCALKNMHEHYIFVGTTERYQEGLCVLSSLLQIPAANVRNDKATTGSSQSKMPDDFVKKWAKYVALDNVAYQYANLRLNMQLHDYEKCKPANLPPMDVLEGYMEKFSPYM